MRKGISPRAPKIASILAALLVVALVVVRSKSGPSAAGAPSRRVAPVAPVDPPGPARPTESAREAEHRASSSASPAAGPSPSGVPSPAGRAAATPPVFDLAALARHGAAEPSLDRDRFRTNDKFTAEDLAHPERYFEAAEHLPELRRDEERHDVLEYFLAYRAQLDRDLAVAGRDADKRAAVLAVIERYDAAIARLRSSLATPAP
jgi:hypothetical protein